MRLEFAFEVGMLDRVKCWDGRETRFSIREHMERGGRELAGADFMMTRWLGVSFDREANLSRALLAACSFENVKLRGSFVNAVFRQSIFKGVTLEGDFSYANFKDTDLSGAIVMSREGAGSFLGASFEGADLREFWVLEASSGGAVDFSHANFSYVRGRRIQFGGSRLQHACFNRADLEGADLRGADLSHASMRACNLEGADLRGANLVGADLTAANIRGARFDGVIHTDTVFPKDFSLPKRSGLGSLLGSLRVLVSFRSRY